MYLFTVVSYRRTWFGLTLLVLGLHSPLNRHEDSSLSDSMYWPKDAGTHVDMCSLRDGGGTPSRCLFFPQWNKSGDCSEARRCFKWCVNYMNMYVTIASYLFSHFLALPPSLPLSLSPSLSLRLSLSLPLSSSLPLSHSVMSTTSTRARYSRSQWWPCPSLSPGTGADGRRANVESN